MTVPSEAMTASKSQTPEAIAEKKIANQQREEREDLWGDYAWIQRHAVTQNKSEQEVAISMGLEKAFAMFGKQQTTVQSQHLEYAA